MTKIKTIKVSGGAEYAQVKDRLKEFRENSKDGSINTEVIPSNDGSIIIKATVTSGEKSATGQSFGKVGAGKAFEKLETIAVGRALAFLGYGADGAIASSEEMEEFEGYKKDKIADAIALLKKCKTLASLKEKFMSLGKVMSEPEVVKVKDELKVKLAKPAKVVKATK